MQQFYFFRATRVFMIAIAILFSAVACRQERQTQVGSVVLPSTASSPASPVSPQPEERLSKQQNAFELALDKAAGGHSISQSARSASDWQLVAGQYQNAIALLRLVERDSPYYSISQSKITEYQRLALSAKKRAEHPTPISSPQPQIAAVPEPQTTTPTRNLQPSPSPVTEANTSQPPPSSTTVSQAVTAEQLFPVTPIKTTTTAVKPRAIASTRVSTTPVPKFYTQQTQVFTVPIKRRAGGTPVIEVTFNGTQKFEMIVDTGASGTVITQDMANALRIIPTTTSKANTASAKDVEFPIGYVNSMEASGVRIGRTPVAIATGQLETGLLGHDFFDGYDITIKRNVVEFRPHTPENPSSPAETSPSIQVYPKPHRSPISP